MSDGATDRQARTIVGGAGRVALGSDLKLVAIGGLPSLADSGNTGGGAYSLLTPATMLSLGGSSTSNNGGSTFGFSVAPAADYFVIGNLSIGLELLIGYASYSPPSFNGVSAQGGNTIMYGVAPRVGYNIPLGTNLSLWPKVFFEHAGFSEGAPLRGTSTSSSSVRTFPSSTR